MKRIQLILIDKNDEVIYVEKCKIVVDKIKERIAITPKKNDVDEIVVEFGKNFKQENKLLYSWSLSSESDGYNLVLIFPHEKTCAKVFNIIYKITNISIVSLLHFEILQNCFIIPFFKAIQNDKQMERVFRPINLLFLESLTDDQKQSCLRKLTENGIVKNLIQKYFVATVSINEKSKNPRKRRWKRVTESESDESDRDNSSDNDMESESEDAEVDDDSDDDGQRFKKSKRKTIEFSNALIKSPNFQIVQRQKKNRLVPKLFVFPIANDKTKCYEYYWYNKKKIYLCCGCSLKRKQIRAKFITQKDGKECVQLQSAKHVCEIREYNSEKYDGIDPTQLIIKKRNFEIFSYIKNGMIRKRLVIFDPTNKMLYHEYCWRPKIGTFECSGCNLKGRRITAKLISQDGNECIQLFNKRSEHICNLREFNPAKFKNEQIIEASNFQIVTCDRKGISREKLIIFPIAENRNQCYEYFWNKPSKKFICAGCSNKGKHLFAKICDESDGRRYVTLTSTEHICEIRQFDAEKYKEDEIVEAPNFEIIKAENAKSMLFIFCPSNKKLGYEYSWDPRCSCYVCLGCHRNKKRTTATLYKSSSGKEYVKLSKTAHICTLREYNPEKIMPNIIVKKPNYEYHEQILSGVTKKKLFIYTSKEQKLGYKFAYNGDQGSSHFYCIRCKSLNHKVPAHIYVDENGEEYVSIRDKKHVCEPVEYLPDEFENRKIVESPNFQIIQRNIRNRVMERLIVFVSYSDFDVEKLCYEYTKGPKSYKCNICHYHHKHNVFAKLIKNSKDGKEEEYVELGPNEHKCKPVKFEPPEALTVLLPNFKIETFTKDGITRKSLIIYLSLKNKRLQYNYYFETKSKSFVCAKCSKKNKRITAKVLKNENGEDYLKLNSNKHLCQPR